MEEHVLHQILVTVLKDIQVANVKQVRFRLLYNEYAHMYLHEWYVNECTKVQNPRRTHVHESLKAHALDL